MQVIIYKMVAFKESIVFLSDKNNNSCEVARNSWRIKGVSRSTLAAESLAFLQSCDTAYLILDIVRRGVKTHPPHHHFKNTLHHFR